MKKLLLLAVFAASVAQIQAVLTDTEKSMITDMDNALSNAKSALTYLQDNIDSKCSGTQMDLQDIQNKLTIALDAADKAKVWIDGTAIAALGAS